MKICEQCQKPLSDSQKRFCSWSCSGKAGSKISRGRRGRQCEYIALTCLYCETNFEVVPSRRHLKFCSYQCKVYAQTNTKEGIYRRIAFDSLPHHCDICGETQKKLIVHHIDGNRQNGDLENLQILCHSCHQKLHYHQQIPN